jgi:DNA-binding IclR family transcriptional regulator
MKFNTLTKSLKILDLLLSANLGENDISLIMKIPRSTTNKYLSILRQYKLLNYDPKSKQYMLGSKFLEYSRARYFNSRIDKIALPYLKKLYNQIGETATLDVAANNEYYTLEMVQKEEGLGFIAHPKAHLPLHCGASGQVLLAFSEEEDIELYLEIGRLKRYTDKTVTEKNRLRKRLSEIKETGYGYTKGEVFAEGWAVAAPIFNHLDKICASLCVLGLIRKDDKSEQAKQAVVKYAKEITDKLRGET